MPRGGSRFAKGSPEAAERMSKAREARAAKAAPAPAVAPVVIGTAVVFDRNKPFLAQRGLGVEINEFTGMRKGFPQTSFGPNFLPDLPSTQIQWPGVER